jgi:hypothetical protein
MLKIRKLRCAQGQAFGMKRGGDHSWASRFEPKRFFCEKSSDQRPPRP